jgi:hypothetical protein
VADIAIVFGWGLAEIYGLSLDDLARWWAKARARAENGQDDG